MAAENTVQKQIWLGLGRIATLFRTNSGRAWISNRGPAGVVKLQDGSVLIKDARSIGLGLTLTSGESAPGQLDLGAGWTPVTITPEMVGKKIAVYTAIEVKRTKGGKASDGQKSMVQLINSQGGIAGIANSLEAAKNIFDEWARRVGAKL